MKIQTINLGTIELQHGAKTAVYTNLVAQVAIEPGNLRNVWLFVLDREFAGGDAPPVHVADAGSMIHEIPDAVLLQHLIVTSDEPWPSLPVPVAAPAALSEDGPTAT